VNTMDRGGSTVEQAAVISDDRWSSIQDSAEFTLLRRRLYRFVFPMSAFFLAWYLGYVLLADYAPGLMSVHVAGNITVGLVMGLLQFLSTFGITALYVRFADRWLDPVSERIRRHVEGSAR
jgi:uncharacterized membrane protein (DUF485 family)